MDKPLKDFTLEEIYELCKSNFNRGVDTETCDHKDDCPIYSFCTMNYFTQPRVWPISYEYDETP